MIARTAEWVARHGQKFEEVLRTKHMNVSGYEFLQENKTRRALFYRERLEYELQDGKWSEARRRGKAAVLREKELSDG